MTSSPFRNSHLDPKEVIENITLKKIFNQFPESARYKSLIKFHHEGKKALLDLTFLPPEIAKKIEFYFADLS